MFWSRKRGGEKCWVGQGGCQPRYAGQATNQEKFWVQTVLLEEEEKKEMGFKVKGYLHMYVCVGVYIQERGITIETLISKNSDLRLVIISLDAEVSSAYCWVEPKRGVLVHVQVRIDDSFAEERE